MKLTGLILIGLFAAFGFALADNNAFDWNSVTTAKQMEAVDDTAFMKLTVENAEAISKHPAACAGISSHQLWFANNVAVAGFSAECVLSFTDDACSWIKRWEAFSSEVLSGGITGHCMAASDYYSLNYLSTKQASYLPAKTCTGIDGARFEQLPKTVVDNLSDDCKSGMDFLTRKWADIKTPAFLSTIPGMRFATIKAGDITAMLKNSATICSGFRGEQLNQIPTASFASFTATCIGHFIPKTCLDNTSIVWQSFPINVFSGITKDCIHKITGRFWGLDSAKDVVKVIPAQACSGLSGAMFEFNQAAYQNISKDCAANFSKDTCEHINEDHITYLTTTAFSAIKGVCIDGFAAEGISLNTVDKEHIAALNSYACVHIIEYAGLFQSISNDALGGLTLECARAFTPKDLVNISAAMFPHFSSQVINYFTSGDISHMSDDVFSQASAATIANLNPEACSGIEYKQFSNMNTNAYSGLSKDCISHLNPSACSVIDESILKLIPPEHFSGFESYCLGHVKTIALRAITSAQLNSLSADACGGFSRYEFQAIPIDVKLAGMNSACFGALSGGVCGALTSLDFADKSVIVNLTPECASGLDCDAFKTLTASTLAQLKVETVTAFPACGIRDLPSEAFGGFTISQIRNMNGKKQCFWISSAQFDVFSVDEIAALNNDCIANLNYKKIFKNISAPKLAGFHDDQCSSFGKGCFDSIGDKEAFGGFTKKCISNFASAACVDMSVDLLNVLNNDQLSAFNEQCVQEWPLEMIKQLTMTDVNGLVNGFVGLCAEDSAEKMLTLINNLPDLPKQLSADVGENLSGGKCWNALNDAMGRGVIAPTIHLGEPINTNLAMFFAEDAIGHHVFGKLKANQIIGLREGHALHFTSEDISNISHKCASGVSSNFYLGLNDERVTKLTADDFELITDEFSYLSVGALEYLNNAQLDELNSIAADLDICYEQAISFEKKQLVGRDGLAKAIQNAIASGRECPSYHYPLPGAQQSGPSGGDGNGNGGISFVELIFFILLTAVTTACISIFVMIKKQEKAKKASNPLFAPVGDFEGLFNDN
eukprot:TRINITY_DN11811_c0_g2_i1.p1 TRINITY_DN11811_c0_g2~~TRINITY_DN11811_c0_g2_i1.p1  ORF type:complete len:1059 (-),score=267.69 TRINITY_DN11811_c0_g2_i1:902-4078(-)